MRKWGLFLAIFVAFSGAMRAELVDIQAFIPGIQVDLKYASEDNFTGQVVYDFHCCLLVREAACRLREVQAELETMGLGLKVWDGYRPVAAQWKFWELIPDERYISDPRKGGRHTRGTAVDLTLVTSDGQELLMPTTFDDFSERAHADYEGASAEAISNRELLREVMERHGFEVLPTEWWHFDLVGWKNYLPIDTLPLSALALIPLETKNMELIAHKQIGSGQEKVLVLHNWMGDSTSYDPMLPYLDTDTYTYVFADLRGYGRSKEMKGSYTVEEASADAMKLIDSLGWSQFHLIGHSMSGMIVQKIAVQNPSKVKSVIAITPVPACGSPGPKEMMDFFDSAALNNDAAAIECVNTLTSHRYTASFARKMVSDNRAWSTSEARLGYMKMFFFTDFSEEVKGLRTPILVLMGEHDFEGSEAFMRHTFMNWYPNAQLEWCKASGHYPMIETPVALATTIEKFLSQH